MNTSAPFLTLWSSSFPSTVSGALPIPPVPGARSQRAAASTPADSRLRTAALRGRGIQSTSSAGRGIGAAEPHRGLPSQGAAALAHLRGHGRCSFRDVVARQGSAGQGLVWLGGARRGKAGQARQGRARQGWAGLGAARQGEAGRGKVTSYQPGSRQEQWQRAKDAQKDKPIKG